MYLKIIAKYIDIFFLIEYNNDTMYNVEKHFMIPKNPSVVVTGIFFTTYVIHV